MVPVDPLPNIMGRKGKKSKLKRAGEFTSFVNLFSGCFTAFSISLLSAAQGRRAKVKGQRQDAKAKLVKAHQYTVDELLVKVRAI